MPGRTKTFCLLIISALALLAHACTTKQTATTATLTTAATVQAEPLPGETTSPVQLPSALLQQFDCIPDDHEVQVGRVLEVFDGDTISVKIGRLIYKVRYIGVNSPEHDEPPGQQAEDFNRSLVKGARIYLVKDITETDQYSRLLRYVFTEDAFVNYEIIRNGYANQLSYEPNTACARLFAEAEIAARESQLGIWGPAAGEQAVYEGIQISALIFRGVKGVNEPDEYVEIYNAGTQPIDMEGWYLKDQATHRFIFPAYVLEPGQSCRVYTNEIHPDTGGFSFEESGSGVWNNGGDCAFLFTQAGVLAAEMCY